MNNYRHIVFIGHLPGFGGAEKSMIMTANALAVKKYKVTIISLDHNRIVYPFHANVDYIFIPVKGKNKGIKIFRRFFLLKNALKALNPDIVVSFWLQIGCLAGILSLLYGFKVIYSERGDPGDAEYTGKLGLLRKLCFPLFSGFVFQSDGARNFFSERIRKKSIVIPNPVYIGYEDYPISLHRDKIIINVGRLHPQKNQALLIRAFSKISKEFSDYKLFIYGDGELKNKLESLIRQENMDTRIYLKGTTPDIYPAIVNGALFVLSSDYEGMPNALMEAMALGIPCIASDCPPGGPADLIVPGKNGLLFSVKDEEQLINNMRYMLKNPDIAQEMGKKAKEICYSHSSDMVFNSWEKFILKLTKDPYDK